MNIYLISQRTNRSYDTYDSAVVTAVDEEAARNTHPSGRDWNGRSNIWGPWCDAKDVKVELLGEALREDSGVLCSSFNAG